MDTFHGWTAPRGASLPIAALSLVLAAGSLLSGCKSDPLNPFLTAQETAGRAGSVHEGRPLVATRPLGAGLLAESDWFEKPPHSYARRDDDERRWHHRRLDPYLHVSAPQSDLRESLESTSPIVATNAAIVVAYWGTSDPTEHLAAAIRSNKLPMPMRAAAAEALGRVEQPQPGPIVRALLAELAPVEPPQVPEGEELSESQPQVPDVHAALLHALSRHAEPGDEHWFNAAIAHDAWQVRVEGVAAWMALADRTLPQEAIELRADRDPRVRAVALATILAHRDPRAATYLQESLDDADFDVRVAAIAGLREIGTAETQAMLARLKDRGAEMQQAATLLAGAASSLGDDLKATAAQAQSQVRLAISQSLDEAEARGRQLAAEKTAEARQYVEQASAQAEAAVDDVKAVAQSTAQRIQEVQQSLEALRKANLPAAARREAALALEKLAADADAAVRVRAAQAMGQAADQVFLPVLIALLSDVAEVQVAAMASLEQIAGSDVAGPEAKGTLSNEERALLWHHWYRERQKGSRSAKPAAQAASAATSDER